MNNTREPSNVTRRDFVRATAAPAAAVSTVAALAGSTRAAQDEKRDGTGDAPKAKGLRIGFIGVGKMGWSHLSQFVGYKDVFVTAICDVDTNRREVARQFVDDK